MKKIIAACISVFVCLFFSYAAGYAADFDENTVIVVMKPRSGFSLMSASGTEYDFGSAAVAEAEKIAEVAPEGFSLFSAAGSANEEVLCLTLAEGGEDKVLEAVDTLNSLDNVDFAQPNYTYYLDATVNDPRYSAQYSLNKVGAPSVWDIDIDCSDTVVAIIDSGVLLDHVDLKDNLWTDVNGYHGYDFIDSDYEPDDTLGHGTHVAGIVSAVTNNKLGVASLVRDAKIAPFKVFDDKNGTSATIIKAVQYILDYESKYGKTFSVINCSFGSPSNDKSLKRVLKKCSDKIIVAAAGNTETASAKNIDLTANLSYPACYDLSNIISVANSTSADKLSSTSCYGEKNVDIAAPGDSILSTYINSNQSYVYMSGTSMATPLVSSAAAALLSKCPNLSPAKAKEYILNGADYVEALDGYVAGARRLNAYNALVLALSPVTVTFDPDGGSAVASQILNYRDTAVRPPAPSRTGYDFKCWLLDGEPYDFTLPVTDNITLTASWTIKQFDITWLNDNGEKLGVTKAVYGSVPTYGGEPVKEADMVYTYKFAGWSPEVTAAFEDTAYTAVFEKTPIIYTIIWRDGDNSIIATDQAEYGTVLSPPEVSNTSDSEYYYVFKEWSPSVVSVSGDAEYTAVFEAVEKNADAAELPVTDSFKDKVKLIKAVTDNHIIISYEPVTGNDDSDDIQPSPAGILQPRLYIYIALYENNSLAGVKRIRLSDNAEIPDLGGQACKMMIWTEDNEPVTEVISDMEAFFSAAQ